MKKQILVFWLCISIVQFLSTHVRAAQDALINVRSSDVREFPEENSKIIQTFQSGDKVHISSSNKDGWYKVRLGGNDYGWIRQSDVAIITATPQVKAADIELFKTNQDSKRDRRDYHDDPRLHIKILGTGYALVLRDLNACLGLNHNDVFLAPGGTVEVAYPLDEHNRIGIRASKYIARYSVKHLGVNYEIENTGFPILFGVESDLYRGHALTIGTGVYIGMSFDTALSVKAPALNSPNSFYLRETRGYAFLGNFTFKHWWTRWLALTLETGFYYNYSQLHQIQSGFHGSEAFRDASGNLRGIKLSHLGPTVSLGFQITFR